MNFAPNASAAGDQVFVVSDLTLADTFKNMTTGNGLGLNITRRIRKNPGSQSLP